MRGRAPAPNTAGRAGDDEAPRSRSPRGPPHGRPRRPPTGPAGQTRCHVRRAGSAARARFGRSGAAGMAWPRGSRLTARLMRARALVSSSTATMPGATRSRHDPRARPGTRDVRRGRSFVIHALWPAPPDALDEPPLGDGRRQSSLITSSSSRSGGRGRTSGGVAHFAASGFVRRARGIGPWPPPRAANLNKRFSTLGAPTAVPSE